MYNFMADLPGIEGAPIPPSAVVFHVTRMSFSLAPFGRVSVMSIPPDPTSEPPAPASQLASPALV